MWIGYENSAMRDLAILYIDLIVTIARLLGSGGARPVDADSLLVRRQVPIIKSLAQAPAVPPSDQPTFC